MTTQDLATLLDAAADQATVDSAVVGADLTRGRRALARTRARRRIVGTLGVFAVAAVGVGVSRLPDPADHRVPSSQAPTTAGIRLVDQTLLAGPYTFDKTPEGWAVQGTSPYDVVIAPVDGSAGDDPDVFLGKLVIMLDQNPPAGSPTEVDGRRFWVLDGDSDHTRISTRTQAGEPEGVVSIQFPDAAGWDRDTMIAFLGSVHVGQDARPGVG
jgi:hypothetical protein